jgi:aminoglycoside/choline kinase family phosphotransferase
MAVGKDVPLSSEREDRTRDFLAEAGLAHARRDPLPGDASTRRYERLYPAGGGVSLILMDQPPALETQPCPPTATPDERKVLGYNSMARLAAGRIEAFVACAGYLRGQGLSAPVIHGADPVQGFAVLEDLGDDLFARKVAQGAAEADLYGPAIDALVQLHETPPPPVLEAQGLAWPLLVYDDLALKTGCDLFLEWWPKFSGGPFYGQEAAAEWEALWAPIRARGEAGASVFTHRDYHAENLIWLPQRGGVAGVGMLDFQDALRAHPAWDLLSLLQDARRDIDPALEAAMLERYFVARPQVDREAFLADYRGLATLNAARILFIFARQVAGFGKPRYVDFMPRTWRYLERNLAAPQMAPLRSWFDRHVPGGQRA